jgi:hypothetical protein
MKKKIVFIIGLLSVLSLLLGACAPQSTAEPDPVEDTPATEEPLPTETEEPAPTETEEPTEEIVETEEPVQLNPLQEVVNYWLVDWNEVFGEDALAMADNMGGQFGAGSGKNYNAEETVFEFSDEGEGIFIPLNTLLGDFCGEECKPGMAIAVTLQPVASMSLNFRNTDRPDMNDFGVEFDDQMQQSIYWVGQAYKEPFESQLDIQPDTWYTVLIAITEDGKYTTAIWESGSPDNMVSFSGDYAALEDSEGYLNVNWKFAMWESGDGEVLKVKNYAVYTFAGFEE